MVFRAIVFFWWREKKKKKEKKIQLYLSRLNEVAVENKNNQSYH